LERFAKIITLLSLNYQGERADEYRPRILLINILSAFIVFLIPIIGIFTIVKSSTYYTTLYFLTIISAVYLLNILLFLKTKNYLLFALFYLAGTILAGSTFYFFFIHEYWVPFWSLVYPVLAMYLLGQKRGNYFSMVLLFILIYSLVPELFSRNTDLDLPVNYRIHVILIYGFLWLLGNIYNWYLDQSIQKVKEAHDLVLEENRKKDQFLTQLSHQIRTPLNDIVAFENLLKKTRIAEEDREMFEMILVSTNNLIQVVQSISESGAFTTPAKSVSKEPFTVREVLDQIKEPLKRQYGEKLTVGFTDNEQDKKMIIGDRVLLKQIFMNVLEGIYRNSQETPHTPQITTEYREEGNGILLSILFACNRDVFDLERFRHLTKLADQGVRVLSDPEDFQYINLLMARSLCHQMKGTLILQPFGPDTPCIRIELPFGRVEGKQQEIPARPATTIPTAAKKELKDAIVMYAEDNPINQKIVKLSLQRYVKQIDIAQDGKEALDLYGMTRYDIILMDIQMPRMDGITVTRKIREIESSTNTHTPIIAITANAMLGDRETCISSGMDEYISKPFQIQTLIRIMEDLLK
jgi:CheY-like chemotaxis protein/signal transduction histidine kinase